MKIFLLMSILISLASGLEFWVHHSCISTNHATFLIGLDGARRMAQSAIEFLDKRDQYPEEVRCVQTLSKSTNLIIADISIALSYR